MIPFTAVLLMTSCSKDAEVRQLMADLATAVNTGDKAAIEKIYPDASKADSLALSFDAENAQIEELESGGWRVVLGEGTDLVVVKNDADGTLSIKESHGVFAVDSVSKIFYERLGCYDRKLNDKENAERMADTLFASYLIKEIDKNAMGKIKLVKSPLRYGMHTPWVVIKNDNDFDIPANEYTLYADLYANNDGPRGRDIVERVKRSNKVIPKKGQAKYSFSAIDPGIVGEEYEYQIKLHFSGIDTFKKDYNPTGNEYAEYLAQKK